MFRAFELVRDYFLVLVGTSVAFAYCFVKFRRCRAGSMYRRVAQNAYEGVLAELEKRTEEQREHSYMTQGEIIGGFREGTSESTFATHILPLVG